VFALGDLNILLQATNNLEAMCKPGKLTQAYVCHYVRNVKPHDPSSVQYKIHIFLHGLSAKC
jgi:hypothetical protein